MAQARKALAANEVPVGCVLVQDGTVIGAGYNDTNRTLCGTRHAEFVAIDEVLKTYKAEIFRKCDLYVTVEPCIMCASALRQLEIRTVYFGAANERFGGCGSVLQVNKDPSRFRSYSAYPGFLRKDAIMLLRQFYVQQNPKAPEPISKKRRVLKKNLENLDYRKYVSKSEFIEMYGHERLREYESGAGT